MFLMFELVIATFGDMLLLLVEWKKDFAQCSLPRTKHLPELTDLKMCFKLSKLHHLVAAKVLTLVLHPLDQP